MRAGKRDSYVALLTVRDIGQDRSEHGRPARLQWLGRAAVASPVWGTPVWTWPIAWSPRPGTDQALAVTPWGARIERLWFRRQSCERGGTGHDHRKQDHSGAEQPHRWDRVGYGSVRTSRWSWGKTLATLLRR